MTHPTKRECCEKCIKHPKSDLVCKGFCPCHVQKKPDWDKLRDLARKIKGYTAAEKKEECKFPPQGWYCTRSAGHDGPCAALPEKDRESCDKCGLFKSAFFKARECKCPEKEKEVCDERLDFMNLVNFWKKFFEDREIVIDDTTLGHIAITSQRLVAEARTKEKAETPKSHPSESWMMEFEELIGHMGQWPSSTPIIEFIAAKIKQERESARSEERGEVVKRIEGMKKYTVPIEITRASKFEDQMTDLENTSYNQALSDIQNSLK